MLTKSNRLTEEKDFEAVFKAGKKYSLPGVKIYLKIRGNNLKQSRFGFVISKKVSKKAVVRNKIKRTLREVVRTNLPGIKKNNDVVMIVLPGFEKNNFQEVKKIINGLFRKAELIKE